MSKILKVSSGDYKVKVQEGGRIILDTGFDSGEVFITGNLVIQGDATTVNTSELFVEDHIIKLNNGETSNGVQAGGGTSGLEIDRGVSNNAFLLWDENIEWPTDSETKQGAFSIKTGEGLNSSTSALRVSAIETNNLNFYFKVGDGVLKINASGTTPYTQRISNSNDIVNKGYVDDRINQIGDSISVTGLADGDTEILLRDADNRFNVTESYIGFNIDGVESLRLEDTKLELYRFDIDQNTIKTKTINLGETGIDLVLEHAGNPAAVVIDNFLRIKPRGFSSKGTLTPSDGVKIYNEPEGQGGTGIYFINGDGTDDELVSRSRAILYGIIF